jgi:hypothetical protein
MPSIVGLAVLIAISGLLLLLAKESPEMHRRAEAARKEAALP